MSRFKIEKAHMCPRAKARYAKACKKISRRAMRRMVIGDEKAVNKIKSFC